MLISGLKGLILFYDRVLLWLFQVKTKQIYYYTIIQLICLALLVAVKLTVLASSFPFFIICLIPLRKVLGKFFEQSELEEVCWQ